MISFVGVRQRHPFSAYRKMTTEENVALRGSTVLVESNRNRRQDIARLQQILVQTRTIPQDTKEELMQYFVERERDRMAEEEEFLGSIEQLESAKRISPIPVYRGRAGQGPPSPDFDAEMKRLFQAEDEGDFEDDEVEERGLSLALVEEGGAVVTAEAQVSSPAPMVAARGREPTARSRSRSRSKSRAGGGGCRKRRGCLSKSILQARKELDMLLARLQLKPDPWSACQLRPSSSFTP